MEPVSQLLYRFDQFIITPAIILIFTAGFFLFVWGLVQFIINLDEGGNRQEGIDHMKWGIAGMLVMVSVQGILMLLNTTFDLGIGPGGTSNPDVRSLDINTIDFGGN